MSIQHRLLHVCVLVCSLQGILAGQISVRESPWFKGEADATVTTRDEYGRIWIGTRNRLFIDDGHGLFTVKTSPDSSEPQLFSGAMITCLYDDQQGNMWVGTKGGGLYRINIQTGAIVHWHVDSQSESSIPSEYIWDIEVVSDTMWMGTDGAGLIWYEPKTDVFGKKDLKVPFKWREQQYIRCLHKDNADDGLLWVPDMDGLVSYRPLTGEMNYYPEDPELLYMENRRRPSFTAVDQAENGDLWLGSYFYGLFHFQVAAGIWESFEFVPSDQFLDNYSLIHDLDFIDDSTIVISQHGYGFDLFNSRQKEFAFTEHVTHSKDLGRIYYYCNVFDNQALLAGTDKCWWVSSGKSVQTKFPAYLRTLKVGSGSRKNSWNTFSPRSVDLNYMDSIWVELSVPSFYNQDVEIDIQWRGDPSSRHQINANELTLLPLPSGGNHQLLMWERSPAGDWSEERELVTIQVHRPWYTLFWWWLLIIGFFVLVSSVVTVRITRQKQRQKSLESYYQRRLAEVQMEALRSQMNPHFLFNSLNSIKDFVISQKPKEAVAYLQKFSELIRSILENSKEEHITLESELESVKLYVDLESLRYNGKFALHPSVSDDVDVSKILVPPLFIQPYVENAIWHGLIPKKSWGEIGLDVKMESDKRIVVTIEDNGIGRTEAQLRRDRSIVKKKSMGMSITKERLNLSTIDGKADIEIQDLFDEGRPTGTKVTIRFTPKYLN